jgi:hypothetical protein
VYAVFMDYELDGRRNTVVLGGSIDDSKTMVNQFLLKMSSWDTMEVNGRLSWSIDEDYLPWGYKYQTYYVSSYDDTQRMIGMK